ncbi:T9SS type A sorting domain-containing protein [Spirosoma sp. HMF3257]|uniref:Transcriptional regulator n=1 Tax=Spirosoma telluris TaxID=2183553 RepID=A0A327NVX5_9BACT|nr:T9SS type A sorting domain-containing protein [Spirosoma telluris]RAI78579.1 transcriptional regulator [Spirosoma telluris]
MNSTRYRLIKKAGLEKLPSKSCFLLVFFYLSFVTQQSALSQIGIWQTHVSYQSGQSVAVIGTKIYAATQNGFFYYDRITHETTTLSKTAGLSDVGISRLLYLDDQKKLLIAYRNGNLDFLTLTDIGEPGTVTNVNTIVSASSLPASRGINHLNRIGNNAYLSTDFGLVVLDLLKNEIRDTYFSQRADGSPLPIYQTTATNDSLYALTGPLVSTGTGLKLRAVRFATSVNIVDPANWRTVQEPGLQLESIVANQGRLSATVNGVGVYERQSGKWTLTQSLANPLIRQFPASTGILLATNKAITLPGSGQFSGSLLVDPREVLADGSTIWVADTKSGLLYGNGGQFQRIAPEGPTRDQFASLFTYPQTLVALPIGPLDATLLTSNQPPAESFSIPANRWVSSLPTGLTRGFNSAAYSPTDQQLYLGSFGGGLWSQIEGQTPVAVTLPATISPFISSLATDIDGNLWITTGRTVSSQQATLHVRRADGSFQSFPIVSQTNIVQIIPDDNGFLWLRPDLGGGLLVVDPQTNRSRFLTTQTGQGGLLSNSIRALVKDRNGSIWVGTDLGPTVFDSPYAAFDVTIDAQPPLLNRRRLLANELITAIAVDGGNRKWIGTQKGIYHVAADGSQLLDTFTAENSPLPNNIVQAVAIEPTSGKVFIETGASGSLNGLVSYQGPATEPAELLTSLTIFPNPVRPDFTGTVGINGLTENAAVKILDAGGQLVYETKSQGGTASWNLRDYRGRQVQTGIYLVVVVTADGSEGLRGKLAVVR